MELEFTPEQDELRAAVRGVLQRECPMRLVRDVVEHGRSPERLWAQMVELGWVGLTVPEAAGGLGLGAVELAVVVEELGRATAPGPFLSTVTQFAPAVREAGSAEQQARFLGGVVREARTGALAIAEEAGSYDPAGVAATATPAAARGAYALAGTKHTVVGAMDADELVVVARTPRTAGDDGVGAFVVPRPAVTVEPVAALDASRPVGRVDLTGVTVERDRVLGDPGPVTARALRRAVEEATASLAVETVGTCQRILDVTLEYAKQREQFGVPIGSFQAIKHKLADMLVSLERARATAYFAMLTIAEDDERREVATSTAKAAAGDCAHLLAKEGIQVHGGVGYTWEHDMHLYVRRVTSASGLFGTATDHRGRIARIVGL